MVSPIAATSYCGNKVQMIRPIVAFCFGIIKNTVFSNALVDEPRKKLEIYDPSHILSLVVVFNIGSRAVFRPKKVRYDVASACLRRRSPGFGQGLKGEEEVVIYGTVMEPLGRIPCNP
jgi:hypothetical protein